MHSRNFHVTGLAVASLVGTLIFLLALDGGAFSLPTRSVLGIAIWWSILLAVLSGSFLLVRIARGGGSRRVPRRLRALDGIVLDVGAQRRRHSWS